MNSTNYATKLKRIIGPALVFLMAILVSETSLAACRATINGKPMSKGICTLATQVYGYVRPGNYWMDQHGNWGLISEPNSRGNLFKDAKSTLVKPKPTA